MEIKFITQGVSEPPKLTYLQQPIVDFSGNSSLTICLVEKGMMSGEPSVMIISENLEGSVIFQTSLDKFLSAANLCMANAESKFGWKQQEGFATIMPMEKETRRMILEQIKAELEAWNSVDEDIKSEETTNE